MSAHLGTIQFNVFKNRTRANMLQRTKNLEHAKKLKVFKS